MNDSLTSPAALPNGPGAAAILAAGIGSLVLGILTVAGDKSKPLAAHMILYRATGPLSGVTTIALAAWLLSWLFLGLSWRARDVRLRPTIAASFILLGVALLLTFPPVVALF